MNRIEFYVQFKDPLKGNQYVELGTISNTIYTDLKTHKGAIRRARRDIRAKHGFKIYARYPESGDWPFYEFIPK